MRGFFIVIIFQFTLAIVSIFIMITSSTHVVEEMSMHTNSESFGESTTCYSCDMFSDSVRMGTSSGCREMKKDVRLFAEAPELLKQVKSSVAYAFETHRRNLAALMKSIDSIVRNMELSEMTNAFLVDVHEEFKSVAKQIPSCWEENEKLLQYLISYEDANFIYSIQSEPKVIPASVAGSIEDFVYGLYLEYAQTDKKISSYDSLEQVIAHLSRDWSIRGRNVRRFLYQDGIIQTLTKYIPPHSLDVENSNRNRILVPGAGAGRLAVEIAAIGYRVEANECSAVMVGCIRSLVRDVLPALARENISCHTPVESNSFDESSSCDDRWLPSSACFNPNRIFPHLSAPFIDDWNFNRRLESVSLVDHEDAGSVLRWAIDLQSASLSITIGDFVGLYSNPGRKSSFDCVTTSFFIDTAVDIVQYLAVISHVLVNGGLWINAGPLHYHNYRPDSDQKSQPHSDPPTRPGSIPYSHRAVVHIAESLGFTLLHQTIVSSSYTGEDELNMKPDYYRIPLVVFSLHKVENSHTSQDSFVPKSPSQSSWTRPNFIT